MSKSETQLKLKGANKMLILAGFVFIPAVVLIAGLIVENIHIE